MRIIFIFGLLVFLILIINHYISNKQKEKLRKCCSEKAIGKIVSVTEYEEGDFHGFHTYYRVRCEYKIGKDIITIAFRSYEKSTYEAGQEIEIYYNPQNTNEYYIEENIRSI